MERVNILVEALPYIKQFYNKKVMIKYGGHAMVDDDAMASTAGDTVLLKYVGMQPLVVHGGGPEITRSMKKLGKEPKFIKGLRVTDEETMSIVKMVLVGNINTDIVSQICLHDGKGAGLSGKDNKLIEACKKIHKIKDEETGEIEEIDLGLVGEIKKINPEILEMYTENDFIPVISPIGIAEDGTTLNLNADTVAGAIAGEMDAEKLIILTDVPGVLRDPNDVPGVLRDPNDPSTLIQRIHIDEIPALIEEGIISGGMIPKIETCVDALNNGVKSAHILDGRIKHTLLLEIFTKEGIGTMIYK